MLGRIFTNRLLPKLSVIALYLLCAGLIFIAFYPNFPIWLDVLIFIPLGASITQIEFDLIDHLQGHGELPLHRDILFRSLAIASISFGQPYLGNDRTGHWHSKFAFFGCPYLWTCGPTFVAFSTSVRICLHHQLKAKRCRIVRDALPCLGF